MLAKLKTLTLFGLTPEEVEVEVDIHRGLPSFSIVGLPDTAVQEAKERVRSAIKNSHYEFPRGKVVVNLAPADLRKHGSRFDLAIALGILHATEQIKLPPGHEKMLFAGELAFTGELRAVPGMLPTADGGVQMGYESLFVPRENASEAALVEDMTVYGAKTLQEICDHFAGVRAIPVAQASALQAEKFPFDEDHDMQHIRGQEHAKRALEIAAAGGHNILLIGPPGSGKTMLARGFPTILPRLTVSEALEITRVYSIAGLTSAKTPLVLQRPYRTAHHTASGVALVGGGNPPRPGEISLAHRGVLFLDEFAEFPQKTLETLRQPLEDGIITVSRASGSCEYPCKFILVAAMNPTPSGYFVNDPDQPSTDTPSQVARYRNKISGPLLDRIDLHVEVPKIPFEKLTGIEEGESSASIAQRVQRARDAQAARFARSKSTCNAEMSSPQVKKYCPIQDDAQQLLKQAVAQMNLSGRAYYRILKVARTIADLANSPEIQMMHVAEAIQYRERRDDF